jgi:hypothetical protein
MNLENMYAKENGEEYEPRAWRIHRVFIAHESCSFMEKRG